MTAQPEFDAFAEAYRQDHAASIRLSGENADYFAAYKAKDTRRLCEAAGISPEAILDFGSGIGNAVAPLRGAFPDAALTCLDVSQASLDLSRRINGEGPDYLAYDGQTLPFADGVFDLIFTACVFHHIPEDAHVRLLGELRRVLRPSGLFVLFEHNPWNPLTRHAVAICPFDENAVLISAPTMQRRLHSAGFGRVVCEYRVFFPRALRALRPLEPLLAPVPLGGQYLLAARA